MGIEELSHEDKRSWHLNAAAIEHACADWPKAVTILTRNLDRMERDRLVAPNYISRCRDLMRRGPETMKSAFLEFTHEGQLLRSIHPWAGLLPNKERLSILRATKRPTCIEAR